MREPSTTVAYSSPAWVCHGVETLTGHSTLTMTVSLFGSPVNGAFISGVTLYGGAAGCCACDTWRFTQTAANAAPNAHASNTLEFIISSSIEGRKLIRCSNCLLPAPY